MRWTDTRRLSLLIAAATLVPIGALTWLGLRILQQDRDVERQRQRDELAVTAGRLVLDVERRLQDIDEQLVHGIGIRLEPSGLKPSAQAPLLYQPAAPAATVLLGGEAVRPSALAAAEVEEFQRHDLARAAALYREVASSTGAPAFRAEALVGRGRVLRQLGDRQAALQVYADLEKLGSVIIGGQPAGLVGLQGRCKLFAEAGDQDRLQRAVATLARALESGSWAIDETTFDLYREMVDRWGGPPVSTDATLRTAAAIELWRTWQRSELPPRGRRILREGGRPVLAVWVGGPDLPVAWLATPRELETTLSPLWTGRQLAVSILDGDGQSMIGQAAEAKEALTTSLSLTPADTRLPFILNVALIADQNAAAMATRRLVVVGGLAATFFFMVAAAYGLYRATTRELMLARQQSDFVSAVSHEFRTPLTSMRHLIDLLATRGVTSEERKSHYYGLLAGETERLHRMVESLLSFGRIEAGAYAWSLEPTDATALVRASVEEFRHDPHTNGREVLLEPANGVPSIQADREALSRAIWNLLENAAKYSDASTPICVFVRSEGESLLVGVSDRGIGVPPAERERIFQKFVRGADARRAGIRGVGIGLALVRRIVEAHGGAVRIDSEVGRGSTFTIVLPTLAQGSGRRAHAGSRLRA